MHSVTPSAIAFRAYTAGGRRMTIDKIDDSKLMQETNNSHGMKNDQWPTMEAPQNYGFSSVVMPADKDKDGNIEQSAEAFMMFPGGNTTLPIAANMDDRRHRLKELGEGDSAMFRTKNDRQQFHFHKEGNFLSARDDRIQRIALVPKPQDEQQQPTGGGGRTQTQAQQQQKKKPTGQKPALDDNKKSTMYIEQNSTENIIEHNQAFNSQRGGSDSTTFFNDRTKSAQSTAMHTHIRFKDFRVWIDETGIWSTVPIQVKQDPHCKE